MGITIRSKHNSADMSYFGFGRFRLKVAEMYNKEFYNHLKKLYEAPYFRKERNEFFKWFDKERQRMIDEKIVEIEIDDFIYQTDCEGSINKKQAKMIYNLIKDCDDSLVYGYSGRTDCATMADMKRIFKDCTHYCKKISWH